MIDNCMYILAIVVLLRVELMLDGQKGRNAINGSVLEGLQSNTGYYAHSFKSYVKSSAHILTPLK